MAKKSATILDVAERSGVSLGTVSRAINGHPSVRPALKARVAQAVYELGYVPNSVARSMRSRSTRTIGLVVKDSSVTYLGGFIKGAQELLHQAGYIVVVAGVDDHVNREVETLDIFAERQFDGLIISVSSESDPVLKQRIATLKMPVVLFDRSFAGADSVCIDHRAGMKRAVGYLLGLGHRRIGMITGSMSVLPSRERVAGYREGFAAHGLAVDEELIATGAYDAAFGFYSTVRLLSRQAPATAIVAGGISLIGGVLRAVREKRVDIPRDLSLVATSDSELTELWSPPISTLRWNIEGVGKAAAQILLDRIAGKPGSTSIQFPTEFVMRDSCLPPR